MWISVSRGVLLNFVRTSQNTVQRLSTDCQDHLSLNFTHVSGLVILLCALPQPT